MIRLPLVAAAAAAAALAAALPQAADAQSRAVGTFQTRSGLCTEAERALLREGGDVGRSIAVERAELFVSRGVSPRPTGEAIEPMRPVFCHAEGPAGKILVSAAEGPALCGWVDGDKLLKAEGGGAATLFDRDQQVCGARPLTNAEFCARFEDPADRPPFCAERAGASVYDAKFLVWNAALGRQGEAVQLTIPTYEQPEGDAQFRNVEIFNSLNIYDVHVGPSSERYLLGGSENQMLGWIDREHGEVWFSRLTAFFSEDGAQDVTSAPPAFGGGEAIARRPGDVGAMLRSAEEFRRYPVLEDRRRPPEGVEASDHAPHMRVAFIGAFCEDGGTNRLCSGAIGGSELAAAQGADIVFLIDATASMRTYFSTVAEAVRVVAADYVGLPDYRLGAFLYGDFKDRERTRLNNAIDLREEIPLEPLFDGTEFDALPEAELFATDAMGDLPEATQAALFKTAQRIPWREGVPRMIIHIGDHGDRQGRADRVAARLLENRVLYAPVAVRGNFQPQANRAFLAQARELREVHLTPGGNPMAARPGPLRAYDPDQPERPDEAFEAIAAALRSALEFGAGLRAERLRELYPDAQLASQGPAAGIAELTQAGLELYVGEAGFAEGEAGQAVAAPGYIRVAADAAEETDWIFQVVLRLSELNALSNHMEILCGGLRDADAVQSLSNALYNVVELLSGDRIEDNDDARAMFDDRAALPLYTRTLLGPGIMRLGRSMPPTTDEDRAALRALEREVCRSKYLVGEMASRKRIENPWEGVRDGVRGSLEWNEDLREYGAPEEARRDKDWVFVNDFGDRMVFLPLDYLPQVPEGAR